MNLTDWLLAVIAFSFAVSLLALIVLTLASRRDRILEIEPEEEAP